MSKKYITFIDAGGRNIIGVDVSPRDASNLNSLTVENPMVILVQPKQDAPGQLAVQLIPCFFAEFVRPDAAGARHFRLCYDLDAVAFGTGFDLADQIVGMYEQIVKGLFQPQVPQAAPMNKAPTVVKLFDEEKE